MALKKIFKIRHLFEIVDSTVLLSRNINYQVLIGGTLGFAKNIVQYDFAILRKPNSPNVLQMYVCILFDIYFRTYIFGSIF